MKYIDSSLLYVTFIFSDSSKLAVEAQKNTEAVTPPLFLKFINLLINDAIFLLDEALANMAKLKEMQQAQSVGFSVHYILFNISFLEKMVNGKI